jgi:hypothetical protein
MPDYGGRVRSKCVSILVLMDVPQKLNYVWLRLCAEGVSILVLMDVPQ